MGMAALMMAVLMMAAQMMAALMMAVLMMAAQMMAALMKAAKMVTKMVVTKTVPLDYQPSCFLLLLPFTSWHKNDGASWSLGHLAQLGRACPKQSLILTG